MHKKRYYFVWNFLVHQSYIQIDIDEPQKALDMIRNTLSNDDFSSHLPYLEEARNLIFEKYNLAKLIENLEPEIFANIQKDQIEQRYLEFLVEKRALQKSLKRRIWDSSRELSKKLSLYEALWPLAKYTKSIIKRK